MAINYGASEASVSSPPQNVNRPLAQVGEVNGRKIVNTPAAETLDRKGNRVAVQREQSQSSELHEKAYDGIRQELFRLTQLRNTKPENNRVANVNDFNELMADASFRPWKEILERFSKLKDFTDINDRTTVWELKEAELERYLKGDGKPIMYELTAIRLQEMEGGIGAFIDENLPQTGRDVIDHRHGNTVTTGDGGVLRTGIIDAWDWARTPFTTYGRETPVLGIRTKGGAVSTGALAIATLTGIGTAVAPGIGTAVGFGIGALGSALSPLFARGFARREAMTVQQGLDALRLSQQNPAVHRKWTRLMYNMDPAAWAVDAAGDVIVNPAYVNGQQIGGPTMDSQKARDTLLELSSMVKELQREMGVRRDQVGGINRPGEQTPLRDLITENDVTAELKRTLAYNVGGVNVPCQLYLGNEWVDNVGQQAPAIPAFNLANLNQDGVWRMRRDIHRRLVANMIAEDADRFKEGERSRLAELMGTVEAKRADSGSGGARTTARVERITAQEDAIDGDVTELQEEVKSFDELQDPLEKRTKALQAMVQARARVTITASSPPITDKDLALRTVLADTTDPTVSPPLTPPVLISIDGIPIASIAGYKNAIKATYQKRIDDVMDKALGRTFPTTGPGAKVTADLTADVEKQIDLLEARMNAELTDIEERLEKPVRAVQKAIIDAQTALGGDPTDPEDKGIQGTLESKEAERRKIQRTTREMMQARATMTSAAWKIGGLGITSVNLQNMSYEALEARINQMNGLSINIGWGRDDNNNPQNRAMLRHAIAEARAAASATIINTPSAEFTQATSTAVTGGNFEETQLLILPAGTIKADLAARSIIMNDTQIAALQLEVTRRFTARQRAIDGLAQGREDDKAPLGYQKTQLETNGIPSEEFDTIERAVFRIGEINKVITDMTREELIAALDTRAAGVVDPIGWTAAERQPVAGGALLSHAEAKIRSWIFNHRQTGTKGEGGQGWVEFGNEVGHDAAFRKYHSQLRSGELLAAAIRRFDFLPTTPPPPTLDVAIDLVRAEIQANRLSNEQFARFITQELFGNYMEQRVGAL